MISVESLLTPTTQENELAAIIEFWQGTGLDTAGWSPMDFERAYAELWAEMSARLKNTLPGATIRNFYLDTAVGIALTYLAASHFDVTRVQSVGTQGDVTLTDDAGGGPFSITTANAFRDPVTGLTYHVVSGDTLPLSGSVAVTVECDTPGALGNVENASITEFAGSSIAGVTLTNGIEGGASWITRLGSNYEKDDVLRERCRTKFATYSPNSPISAYIYLMLSATDGSGDPVGLSKVWVDASNPGGPGTLYIYVANQTATATAQQVTDAQAYIDDNRVSPAAIPTVIAATEVEQDFYGTLYVQAGYGDTALAAAYLAIDEYIEGTDDDDGTIGLPLGGDQLDSVPGGAGFILFDKLIDKVREVPGVVSFVPSTPAGNVALAGNELAKVGTKLLTVGEI